MNRSGVIAILFVALFALLAGLVGGGYMGVRGVLNYQANQSPPPPPDQAIVYPDKVLGE